MWFKNALVFRLPVPWNISRESLEQQLSCGKYCDPGPMEASSKGWIPPQEHGELVHACSRQWLLRLKLSKRILPASVINDEAKKKAKLLEKQQGYPCGKKQMREIKEQVTLSLLPKSHLKHEYINAWADPENGWFVVDAGSLAKAEEVIEQLRHCLSDFPLKPLRTELSPTSAMAGWLASAESPTGFTVDRDCELKSMGEEKSAIAYKRHPLYDEVSAEIKAHLSAGKLPVRLALTWDDRISFVLTEKLEVKRLEFLDMIKEQADQNATLAEEQFDADFALMTGEIQRLIPDLIESLGGELLETAELES